LTATPPTFKVEQSLAREGYEIIAGVDEVGRGALAGPVVAAAVVLPRNIRGGWLKQVRDSKQLTPAQRERLYRDIRRSALAVGIGQASREVIDARGIVPATCLAMQRAVERLAPPPQYLIIDYLLLPEVGLPQRGIINGDALCLSIACASIIAKVTRDRLMVGLDRVYPGYGMARHKGYATREHLACLGRLGPCPDHRRSFLPVREITRRLP